jgi:hypothetical protein
MLTRHTSGRSSFLILLHRCQPLLSARRGLTPTAINRWPRAWTSLRALNHCPSGDSRRLEPNSYAESLNVSSEAVDLVNSMLSQDDVSTVYDEFRDEADQIT